jgi:hypothetical protein
MTAARGGAAFSTVQRSKPKDIKVSEHTVKFYQNTNLSADGGSIPFFGGTKCEIKEAE